jgi:hypothetical protein
MPETPDCIYNRLDSGIHEFIFVNPDRQAVDKHFRQLNDIADRTAPSEPFLVLMDFQRGFPPMTYGFSRAREFNRQHLANPGHYAFLYGRNNVMLSVLQSFFRMLRGGHPGGFFPGDERDNAIAWLLAKQQSRLKK